ncbi:GNAT family N-acetyltransferase [Mycobacterium sp. CVI_P3]|uniref:GNAT family N-acetyltransferase n=1 Tax=Mycobacterium pinniadriaticum TaxID=2994102 RepID=A0ABT3SNG6_9MYCO|nr:GNAT family N-acetyltransferase [Mycobacterium pinniadriaticum]MCX2934643.1 GNAT family N-acetyltransferase [Mycobacterium pinniadriaticum]MCX2941066.1 GNAT family N-acetyltransferase [Mycobacterium pinniadriaticum]
MSEPSLRRATAADAAAIGPLVERAYEKYIARIGRRPAPMDADHAALIDTATVWVLTRGDQLLATMVTLVMDDHVLLESIAVAPDAQGQGYGALLLRRAEDDAHDAGLTEVRLYTNAAMTENIAMYPRYGYVETHRGGQDGFRRVFFSKRL